MKIGTLTFHRACNYGGALQCYALVETLRRMGYNAEVVDYRSRAIENSYKPIKAITIKGLIKSLIQLPQTLKRNHSFRLFSKQYVPTSNRTFYNANDISDQYDFCFIGSDQVWSKRINKGFDPVFWGQFRGKKASYAASMGTDHDFTPEEYKLIKEYLGSFDNISTREDSLKKELEWLKEPDKDSLQKALKDLPKVNI